LTSLGIIFFGDEIQHLYNDPYGIQAVAELVSIGKSPFCMGVISGSSAHAKDLAHKTDPNDQRHKAYPNLNAKVYIDMRLEPLRSIEEIKEVSQPFFNFI
jgi:hypothetical protein